jgi:hypothetical protein
MDFDCVQAHGWSALWPIQEAWERLPRWLNLAPVELAFSAAMADRTDVRPLRKLQSVQTLAYRLLER